MGKALNIICNLVGDYKELSEQRKTIRNSFQSWAIRYTCAEASYQSIEDEITINLAFSDDKVKAMLTRAKHELDYVREQLDKAEQELKDINYRMDLIRTRLKI